MLETMPIRLAQVRLSPQDSYVPTRLYSGGKLRTLQATGYAPDGGFRPYHHGKGPETPTESEGNPICAGSHPKVPTCVNRIGMLETSEASPQITLRRDCTILDTGCWSKIPFSAGMLFEDPAIGDKDIVIRLSHEYHFKKVVLNE